ncbi:hypothetical protein LYSIN_00424 [Lysinibacillus sphaericus]|uniref:Uncharacterized protein n=1 Tax=Lysinibacillus sphaericus TaxID=1421 RepID=A0A2S5CXT4_LYSSH|nr:hypothetical protein [Lysinibacillus sphaericus]POZ55641.1 hypothetical protein LYSIN_00424 [Lysinibacillus sphaericus]
MKITHDSNSTNFIKLSNVSSNRPKMVQQNTPIRKDTLTIGQQARNLFKGQQAKTSLIESLMKQRESIQQMKSDLSERTLENGGDLSSIKEQLKDFEKQIAEIDAQIAEQQMEEQKKATNQKDQEIKKEQPANSMEDILGKSVSLEQMETLELSRNSLGREQNRLESEVALDARRGIFIDKKYEKLSDLEDRIQTVQEKVADQLQNAEDKDLHKEDSLTTLIDELKESKTEQQQDKLTAE